MRAIEKPKREQRGGRAAVVAAYPKAIACHSDFPSEWVVFSDDTGCLVLGYAKTAVAAWQEAALRVQEIKYRATKTRAVRSSALVRARKAVAVIVDSLKESPEGWALYDTQANLDYHLHPSLSVREAREILFLRRWLARPNVRAQRQGEGS